MINFIVDGVALSSNILELAGGNSFEIKSVPKNYKVFWNEKNPTDVIDSEYKEGDVILMDRDLFDLYPVKNKTIYLVEATEDNKSITKILEVIEFLFNKNFNKGNKLLVVGGGIIQDIGAFVSAIYKRGISWVLFPSTVLSMCDSCIGGKTGINYGDTKNQLALFSAPDKIIICPTFIKTLSEESIRSGLGEILKLCVTGGEFFLNLYRKYVTKGRVEESEYYKFLIFGALAVKKAIIESDEFELNIRKSLNYGHTIGHVLESLSNYNIPHGQAIVTGMLIVNKLNKFSNPMLDRLCMDLINKRDLKKLELGGIKSLLLKDKKAIGNEITFVFVDSPGNTVFSNIKITNKLITKIEDSIREIYE